MEPQDDFLPNRLNFDAIIFCGCTFKEMQVIAISSLISCMVILGLLAKLLIGMLMVGIGFAFPASVGVSWFIAMIFQKAKQGKPKGYVKQKFNLWLEDKGIAKSLYTRRTGKWSVGRYLD
jgi:conjugative transfer region protein (TIGR03750 family)